jgi:hypothetical protein
MVPHQVEILQVLHAEQGHAEARCPILTQAVLALWQKKRRPRVQAEQQSKGGVDCA